MDDKILIEPARSVEYDFSIGDKVVETHQATPKIKTKEEIAEEILTQKVKQFQDIRLAIRVAKRKTIRQESLTARVRKSRRKRDLGKASRKRNR